MTIKNKLTSLVILILVFSAVIFGLLDYSLRSLDSLKSMEVLIGKIEADKSLLRNLEQSFAYKLDAKTEKGFADTVKLLESHIRAGDEFMEDQGIELESFHEFEHLLEKYQKKFKLVTELTYVIGLSESEGLRGELRQAIKEAEKSILSGQDGTMWALILQLRRNEKDFIIRQELKYAEKFNKNFERAYTYLSDNFTFDAETKQKNQALMQEYRNAFNKLVAEKQKLGLTPNEGLFAEISVISSDAAKQLGIVSGELKGHIEAEIGNLELFAATVIIIACILLCLTVFFINRSITKPIDSLGELMQNVKDSKNLSLRYDNDSTDEIGVMGHNFNEMMELFHQLIGHIKRSSNNLTEASINLSSLSNETSKGLDDQQHEVVQVVSAVQQMEVAMQEIANNTEMTSSAAQAALTDSSNSRSTVSQLISDVEGLAQQAQDTNSMVQKLQSNSDEIGSVLDVIKSIAEQTNLLALNASIEAARAGDHGRGFAVVADEVRSLAARTQESASEIESMITELQGSTVSVSSLMSASVEQSQQSAGEATSSISALDSITDGASNIVDMTTQVASATEEQAAVAALVNKNIEHIRDIIEQTNVQTHENSQISTQVSEEAKTLQNAVAQFQV